jgi:type I restriction enzyme, S subunit
MNAQELLRNYERVADAPDALSRLRQLVLDLAVRGKLLPQQSADRPQTDALAHARKELSERAKATGRLRFAESAPICAEEVGDQLPKGWVAARVNDTGLYINGLAFKPSDWKASGLPIIRIQNLSDESREFNYAQGEFPDEVLVRTGDILVSWSATLDAYLWKRETGVLNQHIFRVIQATGLTDSGYLLLLLKRAIRDLSESVHAHGLVMAHINRGPFLNHVVWIPPLPEQHRIVAKVEELMGLCDRLGVAQAKCEASRDRLTAASLGRLNDPEEDSFLRDAGFVVTHIGHVTRLAQGVEQLRRTVLNLAVRGKLTKQLKDGETSTSLLQRIVASQPSRVRERSVAPEPTRQHEIPDSWCWSSLGAIIIAGPQNGLSPRPSKRLDAPKAVTLTATTSGRFDPRHFKQVEADVPEGSDLWLKDGDLLFQRGNTREYVGIAAIYRGPEDTFLYPDLMIRVRVSPDLSLPYIHLVTLSPPARDYMARNATGAQLTMPKINQATLLQLPIPVPPREEQDRIVALVERLMSLCDQLEKSIKEADHRRSQLLDVLLHQALQSARQLEATA